MISISKEDWEVLLTDDLDYINFSHLAAVNDLYLRSWSNDATIRVVMKHLEDLGMSPSCTFEDQIFVRTELLHTILSPTFISLNSPSVPDFFVRDLLDLKISQAGQRMGKELPCINLRERRSTAIKKVDTTHFHLAESEERHTVLEELQSGLDRISGTVTSKKDPSSHLISEGTWKLIDSRMLEASYTVRELAPLIVTLRRTEIKSRSEAVAKLQKDLRDLNSAIRCEIEIRKVEYRLMLSQLMIHEAHIMSAEASAKVR